MEILRGDSLSIILERPERYDLIVTDPPYAFGGSGAEHELSATVAVVLREAAQRLRAGRWMVVFCAASWRSQQYMVDSVRGILTPVRSGTWCKPEARTKVQAGGWSWQTVKALAFRKGKAEEKCAVSGPDWILESPVRNGRRAELPPSVADWAVLPYAVNGGLFLDPFAGSGALCAAAERAGMSALGFEKGPPDA